MTISIKLPEQPEYTGGVREMIGGHSTKVFNEDGTEINHITAIDISIRPDEIVTATVEVAVDSRDDMENIHALLGTTTLHQIAAMHGFRLESMGVIGSSVAKEKIKG